MKLLLIKIKNKWGIKSNIQFIVILFVFSLTGSLSLIVSKPLLELFNINKIDNNSLIYYVLRIIIVFPSYQLLILVIGWIFGQFNFFWNFQKKILVRISFKRLKKDN
tara:strand:+ start:1159 stop:1479 length:321 start_codon:yes stop_codon:yes gene_type:complete